jgi:hypothetical protein
MIAMASTEAEKTVKKPQSRSRLPAFRGVEEEAEFWDSHSPLDYPEEFEEVEVKVERPLQHLLGVRLDAKTITKLGEIARKKGIGPSTLARIWLMERLADEVSTVASKSSQEPGPSVC